MAGEIQPPEAKIAALQQEAGSLLHPPGQHLDGGTRLIPSEEQLTPQEIRQRFTFDVAGEKTNLPDYLKDHLPQLLGTQEATTIGIDTAKPMKPEDQLKIAKHLLKKVEENPQEIAVIRKQLTELPIQAGTPQIIASLQALGIEALQQQYIQENGTPREGESSYKSTDATFGEGSRRKVYTRMGGIWDEVTLKGDAMKAFNRNAETPRLNTTVEMDLRLAQSLFNAALPPERVIEVAKLQMQVIEAKDPVEKAKLTHDLTLLRQKLYKATLVAFNVKPEKGEIVVTPDEKDEIQDIANKINLRMVDVQQNGVSLQSMSIGEANSVANRDILSALDLPEETASLFENQKEEMQMALQAGEKLDTILEKFFQDKLFDSLSAENKKLAQRLLGNNLRTDMSLQGLNAQYAKQGGLKPENITLAMYLPMGLKGTELLYRRTLSKEEPKEGTPQPAPEIPDWLNPKIPILELTQNDDAPPISTPAPQSVDGPSLLDHPASTYRKGDFRKDVQKTLQQKEDWKSVQQGEPIPHRKKRGEEDLRPPGRDKQDRRIPNPNKELSKRQEAESSATTDAVLEQLQTLRQNQQLENAPTAEPGPLAVVSTSKPPPTTVTPVDTDALQTQFTREWAAENKRQAEARIAAMKERDALKERLVGPPQLAAPPEPPPPSAQPEAKQPPTVETAILGQTPPVTDVKRPAETLQSTVAAPSRIGNQTAEEALLGAEHLKTAVNSEEEKAAGAKPPTIESTTPAAPIITLGTELQHPTIRWMRGVVNEITPDGYWIKTHNGNTYFIKNTDLQPKATAPAGPDNLQIPAAPEPPTVEAAILGQGPAITEVERPAETLQSTVAAKSRTGTQTAEEALLGGPLATAHVTTPTHTPPAVTNTGEPPLAEIQEAAEADVHAPVESPTAAPSEEIDLTTASFEDTLALYQQIQRDRQLSQGQGVFNKEKAAARQRYEDATERFYNQPSVLEDIVAHLRQLDPERAKQIIGQTDVAVIPEAKTVAPGTYNPNNDVALQQLARESVQRTLNAIKAAQAKEALHQQITTAPQLATPPPNDQPKTAPPHYPTGSLRPAIGGVPGEAAEAVAAVHPDNPPPNPLRKGGRIEYAEMHEDNNKGLRVNDAQTTIDNFSNNYPAADFSAARILLEQYKTSSNPEDRLAIWKKLADAIDAAVANAGSAAPAQTQTTQFIPVEDVQYIGSKTPPPIKVPIPYPTGSLKYQPGRVPGEATTQPEPNQPPRPTGGEPVVLEATIETDMSAAETLLTDSPENIGFSTLQIMADRDPRLLAKLLQANPQLWGRIDKKMHTTLQNLRSLAINAMLKAIPGQFSEQVNLQPALTLQIRDLARPWALPADHNEQRELIERATTQVEQNPALLLRITKEGRDLLTPEQQTRLRDLLPRLLEVVQKEPRLLLQLTNEAAGFLLLRMADRDQFRELLGTIDITSPQNLALLAQMNNGGLGLLPMQIQQVLARNTQPLIDKLKSYVPEERESQATQPQSPQPAAPAEGNIQGLVDNLGLTKEQAALLEERLQSSYYKDAEFRRVAQLTDEVLRDRFANIAAAWHAANNQSWQGTSYVLEKELKKVYKTAPDRVIRLLATMLPAIDRTHTLPLPISEYLPSPPGTKLSDRQKAIKNELLAICRAIQILADVTSHQHT